MADVGVLERKCETPSCNKAASLRCPTCIKLGISGSFFCSQDCFKGSWKEHRVLHKNSNTRSSFFMVGWDSLPNSVMAILHMFATGYEPEGFTKEKSYCPWPDYKFSGKLRPFPVTPKREVADFILRPDYAEHPKGYSASEQSVKTSTVIKVLDDEEIQGVKLASKLAREVLDCAAAAVGVGVTTDEIDRVVHEACIERDCYPSPLNYYNFPKSCCTSVNEVICHGIPDKRPLEDGDILNIDVTVYHRGFHGDLNETLFVGNVDESAKKLVSVTYESLMKAIAIVKPGERYREIGNVIQKYVNAHGFSVVRSYCGHGIHRLFHTAPSVPHYSRNKAVGVMKPGHCFTIEPMISEGTWRDQLWPDNWTAVTQDGKRSAQFEQTLLVTDNGCEILTKRRDHDGQPYFMDH